MKGREGHAAHGDGQGEALFRYRTRWGVWLILLLSVVFSLAGILLRGGAVEWFAFIALTGVMLASGLLPAAAAAGLGAVRSLDGAAVTRTDGWIGGAGSGAAGAGNGATGEGTAEAGAAAAGAGGGSGAGGAGKSSGAVGAARPVYTMTAEDTAVVRLELKRSWRMPLVWIAMEDAAANQTGTKERGFRHRALMVPMLRRAPSIAYSIGGLSRGAYLFGPLHIIVGDWLGITAIRLEIPQPDELLVLPAHKPVPRGEAEAGSSGRAGRTTAPAGAGGASAGEERAEPSAMHTGAGPDSRPYREGDPLRHLDFRAAARGRGLYTKVEQPELPVRSWIVVDQYAPAYGGDDALFDACISLAAGKAASAAMHGGGATVMTRDWSFELTGAAGSGSGSRQLPELLRLLAYLRTDDRKSLAASLREAGLSLTRDGALQLFSADWQDAQRWTEIARELGAQQCRVELYLATGEEGMTTAMGERQRALEAAGLKVTWLHAAEKDKLPWTAAREGADVYAAG